MRGLIGELEQLLDDDDPRWYAFGLNRPSDPETPSIPDTLVLTPGNGGMIHADWADAHRAERYRVFKQVVGAEADFVPRVRCVQPLGPWCCTKLDAPVSRIFTAQKAGHAALF